MPTVATPLFGGPLHDTALRLARAHGRRGTSDTEDPDVAWRQMRELGWQGVLVAEDHGGAGGALADLAAIVEALATQALPVPLIERCAIAPNLLAGAKNHPGARDLLEKVASGDASVAPVLHTAPQDRSAPAPELAADGRLRGTIRGADWDVPASHVVFDAHASAGGTPALMLLEAAPLSSRMRRYAGVDGRICADIDVDGIAVPAAQVLLDGPEAAAAIDWAQQVGGLLGCASTVGACGAMVEQTIEYLNTRVQFGTALSTFQALRHRVVDMYVAYENARGLVRERILQHARKPDARQVALARLYVQQVGRTLGESAIQLHGGMGMSQETLAARLALQVFMAGQRFGDKAACLDWLTAGFAAEPLAA
jgi:alkylation response protein AidB-like acyl-CoA dehydrogenase